MIPQITAEEMLKAVEEKNATVKIVDVRTPPEYARGKIEGSVNLPVDRIADIASLLPDKNATVYLYCLSGSRSDAAAQAMIALGYTHVFSMTHGLLIWRSKKYPLVP